MHIAYYESCAFRKTIGAGSRYMRSKSSDIHHLDGEQPDQDLELLKQTLRESHLLMKERLFACSVLNIFQKLSMGTLIGYSIEILTI